jgi:hypothetical protein
VHVEGKNLVEKKYLDSEDPNVRWKVIHPGEKWMAQTKKVDAETIEHERELEEAGMGPLEED